MQVSKNTFKEELEAYQSLQSALARLKTNKITNTQTQAIRDLLHLLDTRPPNLGQQPNSTHLVTLNDEELKFLSVMKEEKLHPEILSALRHVLEEVISNPMRGKPLSGSIYASLFRNKIPTHTGKVLICKVIVRLRYRLIYAYGGSLTRPVFLEFNHRKDIYKHAGFGQSSS